MEDGATIGAADLRTGKAKKKRRRSAQLWVKHGPPASEVGVSLVGGSYRSWRQAKGSIIVRHVQRDVMAERQDG